MSEILRHDDGVFVTFGEEFPFDDLVGPHLSVNGGVNAVDREGDLLVPQHQHRCVGGAGHGRDDSFDRSNSVQEPLIEPLVVLRGGSHGEVRVPGHVGEERFQAVVYAAIGDGNGQDNCHSQDDTGDGQRCAN